MADEDAAPAKAEPKTEPARPAPSASGGRSFAVPPLVTWTLVSVGIWLIFVALRGLSPLDEIKAALTGNKSPGKKYELSKALADKGALLETDGPAAASFTSRAGSQSTGYAKPSNLVVVGTGTIGNLPIELAPAAAQGFRAWEAAFGGPIKCTSGWRSYAQQADGFESDPNRFADPDKSWHVKGTAVDVDLAATGASFPGAGWDRLYTAAMATGWCNPRGPYSKRKDEAHHFSFGGCG